MAASSKCHRILSEAVKDEIKSALAMFEADKKGTCVPVKDKLAKLLLANGGAERRKMLSNQVCPHFRNRDEQILSASGVPLRGERVLNTGFSRDTFERNAWAVEENPVSRHLAAKVVPFLAKDARFAVYQPSEIKAGSVGASHMNHVVESVRQERPCLNAAVSEDGRWSQALWFPQGNGEFGDVVTNGSWWYVIRWEVEDEFPQIPHIFQSALNSEQGVGEGDCHYIVSIFCYTIVFILTSFKPIVVS